MAQRKEDIVCAFHGDLEIELAELNMWMKSIDKKLGNLLMWRARVIGYSVGASAAAAYLIDKLHIFG